MMVNWGVPRLVRWWFSKILGDFFEYFAPTWGDDRNFCEIHFSSGLKPPASWSHFQLYWQVHFEGSCNFDTFPPPSCVFV